jgi:hypothetical protein
MFFRTVNEIRVTERHLRAVCGLLAVGTLIAINVNGLMGIVMVGLDAILVTAATVGLLLAQPGPEGSLFIDGPGMHPAHGVLALVPTTAKGILARLAIYALLVPALAFPVFGNLNFLGPGASDVQDTRLLFALLLVFCAAFIPINILAMPVVRRWGATPPPQVLMGWAASSALLGLLVSMFAAFIVTDWRHAIADAGANVIRAMPVVSVFVFLFSTWIRHIPVARWQDRLDEQRRLAAEAEQSRKLAEAQLAMMQAQIEPHFLYNTLASVQYLVKKDAKASDFLLTQLIRYLRHAMPKLRAPMSTLAQEFELADAYLQIARMRMGGRLTVSVELDSALHEIPFPPLVLQTLVENALKHGVEPKLGAVTITVASRRTDAGLAVDVLDNGVGLGKSPNVGSGTGLANIRERLAGIYGARAQLNVTQRPSGGTASCVTVPAPTLAEGR